MGTVRPLRRSVHDDRAGVRGDDRRDARRSGRERLPLQGPALDAVVHRTTRRRWPKRRSSTKTTPRRRSTCAFARPTRSARALLERFGLDDDGTPLSVAIWTTTPWTLPANVAIALKPDATYGVYRAGDEDVIFAQRAGDAGARAASGDRRGRSRCAARSRARRSNGSRCAIRSSTAIRLLVLADYVELETGTGVVHTAPGHGDDDFETGVRYGLPIINPVDAGGRFTAEAGPYAGLQIFDANARIVEDLRASGALIAAESYDHSYPHCWRCKNPVDLPRDRAVVHRDGPQGAARARRGVRARRHVASRRGARRGCRRWSATIPSGASRASACGGRRSRRSSAPPATSRCSIPQLARNFAQAMRARSFDQGNASDLWWTEPLDDVRAARPGVPEMRRHGVRQRAQHRRHLVRVRRDLARGAGRARDAVPGRRVPRRRRPVPRLVPLEPDHLGRDARRRALQAGHLATAGSSISTATRCTSRPATTSAREERSTKYGADVLRLWVASSEFTGDVRLGAQLLENVANVYRNLRNRLRYLLGFARRSHPRIDRPARGDGAARPARARTRSTPSRARSSDTICASICTPPTSRSSVSTRKISRRSTSTRSRTASTPRRPAAPRRRSAQSALLEIFRTMRVLLAPVLSFTAEEAWQHLCRGPARRGRVGLRPRVSAAVAPRRAMRSRRGSCSKSCARRSPRAKACATSSSTRRSPFRRSSTRFAALATACAKRWSSRRCAASPSRR